jgi:hypothetical protein
MRIILCLTLGVIFGCSTRQALARDVGQWEAADPAIQEWYKSLMRRCHCHHVAVRRTPIGRIPISLTAIDTSPLSPTPDPTNRSAAGISMSGPGSSSRTTS